MFLNKIANSLIKMPFNFIWFTVATNFLIHRITGEPFLPSDENPPPTEYSSNTPFSSDSDMESFIRNEWRDYPTTDVEFLIKPMKEIIHTIFNPDKTNIRVCHDLPLAAYKNQPSSNSSQRDKIYIITPSSVVPLKYFKTSMEMMTILNEADEKLRDSMLGAMKNYNSLETDEDGEISRRIKNCDAAVVVPHLFKSNYCVISPVIDLYLRSLADVSLVKLGNIFLRYNSVKNLVRNVYNQTWNETGGELETIPITKFDEVPFENLRTIVETFDKNHSTFYLKMIHESQSAGEADIPLSHWTIVYDSLHTDVRRYLKSIIRQNGSNSEVYKNLPWIGYRKEITKSDNPFPNPEQFSLQHDFLPHSNIFDDMVLRHPYYNPATDPIQSTIDPIQADVSNSDDFDTPILGQVAHHQSMDDLRSQIRHHVEATPESESYKSMLLKYIEMKKLLKNYNKIPDNENRLTNKINRNQMVGKFAPLNKDKLRYTGRNSDQMVMNVRKYVIENTEDDLVEELRRKFGLLRS